LKILAIDTATEQCSVALRIGDIEIIRGVVAPRGHADLILPMIHEVLSEADISLKQLDAIAFGRGPGAFTGVRIAVGVVQGLAFATDRPVIAISNLAAVAQQIGDVAAEVLVCMDARMGEVYWGRFKVQDDGLVRSLSDEQVGMPESVIDSQRQGELRGQSQEAWQPRFAVGTAFTAYPILAQHFSQCDPTSALPHAREIALLAERDFKLGLAVGATLAQPIYVRDRVTHSTAATNKP